MSRWANQLAQMLAGQISRQTASPDVLELGTIQGDMSLKVDRFPIPIPAGEYMVCRGVTLVAGDRVLIGWTNDGTDPVVINVVGVMTGA